MNCPVCGGTVKPTDTVCEWCGVPLTIESTHQRIDPKDLDQSRIHESIAGFRRALQINPNDVNAHIGLGYALFSLGVLDGAVKELEQAVDLVPEDAMLQHTLAVVYSDLYTYGDRSALEKALTQVKRAARMREAPIDTFILKADLHLRHRQSKEALEAWREAYAREPHSIRRPIAAFLTANRAVLERMERFSTPPKVRDRGRLIGVGLIGLFLAICVVALILDSTVGDSGGTSPTVVAGRPPSVDPQAGSKSDADDASAYGAVGGFAVLGAIVSFIGLGIREIRKRKKNKKRWVGYVSPEINDYLAGTVKDPAQLMEAATFVVVDPISGSIRPTSA